MATEAGLSPVPKPVLAPKDPSPPPSTIDTVFAEEFAVAMSSFPSAFRSPTARERGSVPTSYERNLAARKTGVGEHLLEWPQRGDGTQGPVGLATSTREIASCVLYQKGRVPH
jgi:hypothetical protein